MFRSIVKPFILMIIFIVCIGNFSFAKNIISNISIDVVINDDGSANITQTWDGTFEEGTECYLPIDTNDFEISNLTVKMGDKRFKNIEWDLNKSFEEKSYKCGINKTDVGVELCFGISKYGKNKYTFSYDISKLVGSYTDYDGFNFQFVNTNMDSFPTNVEWKAKLKSGKKLTYDNSRIWGFGYNGDVEISNGIANAKSSQSLVGDNYFTIMMQFNKGILKPKFSRDESFEDVKSVALNLRNDESQDTIDADSNTNANNNISDNIVRNEKSDLKSQIERAKLVTEYSPDTSVEDMDTVSFGSYPQFDATGKTKDPIEWIVLERDKDNERALLLSKYILDYKSYNAEAGTGFEGGPMDLGGPVSWATCALREWLNSEFYDKAFDNKEKEHIIMTCIMNRGINDQIFFSDAVYDNVFLLDIRDVEKYFGEGTKTGSYNNYKEYQYFKKIITKNSEIKDYSDYDEYTWWLRSLNSSQRESWVIRDDGTSGVYEVNCWMLGIRPAIWVSYGNQDTNEMINDDGLMNQAYETWDDNMLNQSSYSYNHNVARLSAKIAKYAYDEDTLKNIIKNDLGFSNIQTYNYGSIESKKLDYDRGNCFAISHKNVNESGENATILFIVARGTKADENPGELLGDYFKSDRKDLYFGNNENNYHSMLNCSIYDNIYDFYEQIEKGIKDYIEKFPEIKIDKNLKVLLTGHSLGGAAVNLYAAKLIDDIKHNNSINEYIKQEAVFTYTFGAITVIKNVINNYERGYENIFNIYNYYDSFGPHGNYAWTYASSPYKKFGYTLIYNDDRLYFEENGMSNNNHKMENYMSALNLYNFYHEFPSTRKNYDYKINSDFVSSNVQAKIIADYNNSINSNSVSKSYYQETIKFGSYPQNDVNGKTKEPIEWIVLEKDGNKALFLSKYILDNKCFNDEWSVNKTWETSQLRSWLNDTFYRTAFSKDEQKKILSTTIINSNNIDFKTSCGNNTNDKVFLLSIDEVRKYFGSGVKEEFGYRLNDAVATQGTKYSGIVDKNNSFGNNYYWLRSMGIDQFAASFIAPNGYLATHGYYLTYGCGVRPALWVSY